MFVVRTSKPVEMGYFGRVTEFRYTFYRPQTNRLRARKIGFPVFLLGTSGEVPCAIEDLAGGY